MTSLQSLPRSTYLVGYDLEGGKLYDRTRTAFLVNAAALTELRLRGLIEDDGGSPRVLLRVRTEEPELDELLGEIAARRRSWKAWLRHHYKRELGLAEAELESAGTITVSRGWFGRRRVTVRDATLLKTLQAEVTAVLAGDQQAAAVTAREAALALLASVGGVRHVLPGGRARGGGRVDELAARLDAEASPMGKVIPRVRMTMIAAQGGMGGS